MPMIHLIAAVFYILPGYFPLSQALDSAGPFFIQNLADCNVLDLQRPMKTLGADVITTCLQNLTTQMWDIYDVGAGFMIVNRYNGLALDVAKGCSEARCKVVTWAASFSCNQRWAFEDDGTIRSGFKNLVLDVCGAEKGKESAVIAYPHHGKNNQRFRTIIVGSFAHKPRPRFL